MICMNPIKVTVIVPVYNCEEYIPACLQSLLAQTLPQSEFEVLLINDGSTDNSAEICRRLAEEHANVRFFDKENGGVSSTRNMGIENAEGKYFLFLDADDTLTPDTLKTVSQFFDKHYDEIDMVTYRIVPFWEDHRYPLHYRYKILQKTGIYDLNEGENRYITQTTMNICVKNLGKGNNVLFDTSLVYHEDQKYCLQVLDRYMKLGFCDGPEYITPGIPNYEGVWEFFSKRGYVHGWGECECVDMSMPLAGYAHTEFSIGDTENGYTYRWAELEDIPAIADCVNTAEENFTKYYRNEALYDPKSSQRVLIAVDDELVSGALSVSAETEAAGIGSVGCTATRADHQGRGIATTMVKLGTKYLHDIGLPTAFLGYTYTDIVSMYGRAGYEVCRKYMMAVKTL